MPSLQALIESRHDVVGVVTAPDRPQGRGMKLSSPPVKKAADQAGVPAFQTPSVKTPEAQERLRELGADLFVVVAFGFILPKAVLEMPRFGCINVHFSLLPLLRGAAPVQWALIEGHSETGVTIMQLDEGMDTGPMLARLSTPISADDNTESVEERLADLGAKLLVEVVDEIESGKATPEAQNESLATYAPKISAEDAHLDWSKPAEKIANKVRGLTPRPGAWGVLNGKRLKIWKAKEGLELPGDPADLTDAASAGPPGTLYIEGDRMLVGTGSGLLALEEVQPEGKARMNAGEFIRGYRPATGDLIL